MTFERKSELGLSREEKERRAYNREKTKRWSKTKKGIAYLRKARMARYYKNKEKELLRQMAWREKNKEKVAAGKKDWARKNRDKLKRIRRRFLAKNRLVYLAKQRWYQQAARDMVKDWYVKMCWRQYGINEVPRSLIEPMREYILLSRTILQAKKELENVRSTCY